MPAHLHVWPPALRGALGRQAGEGGQARGAKIAGSNPLAAGSLLGALHWAPSSTGPPQGRCSLWWTAFPIVPELPGPFSTVWLTCAQGRYTAKAKAERWQMRLLLRELRDLILPLGAAPVLAWCLLSRADWPFVGAGASLAPCARSAAPARQVGKCRDGTTPTAGGAVHPCCSRPVRRRPAGFTPSPPVLACGGSGRALVGFGP